MIISHYLLENGEPIARFNELEKAEAARAMYVAELAAMYERNAERFTSTPAEKEAVIKVYDTLVKSPEDRKKLERTAPLLVAARGQRYG
jgi:phage regulator Rha-like protein